MTSALAAAGFRLSYVDFPPRCAGAGGIICAPEYERFDVLVTRANEWLKANPYVKVKTCESIEVKGRLDGIVDTRKSSYFEADHCRRKMRNMYIRALRTCAPSNTVLCGRCDNTYFKHTGTCLED
ncbi:hypothetical protein LSAT2_018496 [Lamellibrachia satsuma]|nr:hypothetical protein LSAT2_018496 [Lamellibrachia satsuma]